MKSYTYIYKRALKVGTLGCVVVAFCFISTISFGQTQSNNSQSQYIAPKTKQDIANDRAQKKIDKAEKDNTEYGVQRAKYIDLKAASDEAKEQGDIGNDLKLSDEYLQEYLKHKAKNSNKENANPDNAKLKKEEY